MSTKKIKPPTEQKLSDAELVSKELRRLASALEKQNYYRRRFMSGVVFGVGTALGASVIATLVILLLTRIFTLVGITDALDPIFGTQILEQQIKQQTPQE